MKMQAQKIKEQKKSKKIFPKNFKSLLIYIYILFL